MTEVSQEDFETAFNRGSGSGSRPSEALVRYETGTNGSRDFFFSLHF